MIHTELLISLLNFVLFLLLFALSTCCTGNYWDAASRCHLRLWIRSILRSASDNYRSHRAAARFRVNRLPNLQVSNTGCSVLNSKVSNVTEIFVFCHNSTFRGFVFAHGSNRNQKRMHCTILFVTWSSPKCNPLFL